VFGTADAAAATGLLFDSKQFAVMAIAQPAESQTPDLNADKEGDRILICLDGDLSMQIGENRFRLGRAMLSRFRAACASDERARCEARACCWSAAKRCVHSLCTGRAAMPRA